MSRLYPAVHVTWLSRPDDDRLDRWLAEIDDDRPTAVEEHAMGLRIFFPSAIARGRAAIRLVALEPDLLCELQDVPDDDWAERSQASLGAVRVGRLVIAPPWAAGGHALTTTPEVVFTITIQPSMGFGTGHHASTRLCLRLLQELRVADAAVLDVGTGSGVLALAAATLGAARVLAIDNDEDALASARENVERNSAGGVVTLHLADLGLGSSPPGDVFDLVLANLTGAVLARLAGQLAAHVGPGGTLITSGYGPDEEQTVARAFSAAGLTFAARAQEEEWLAMTFTSRPAP